jgi:hypothetical protein
MLLPSGPLIINASGGNIPSWQFVDRQLHFGNNRFTHSFLQANVSQPMLGADFLQQAKATIDFNLGRVCFPLPNPPLPPQSPSVPSVSPSLPTSSVTLSPQIAHTHSKYLFTFFVLWYSMIHVFYRYHFMLIRLHGHKATIGHD